MKSYKYFEYLNLSEEENQSISNSLRTLVKDLSRDWLEETPTAKTYNKISDTKYTQKEEKIKSQLKA